MAGMELARVERLRRCRLVAPKVRHPTWPGSRLPCTVASEASTLRDGSMACSYCGKDGHNIQTCGSVRRCGHCHGRGHDRRNCPELVAAPSGAARGPRVLGPCSMSELRDLCDQRHQRLIHLYWPDNKYFTQERGRYRSGEGWHFVATPGHGVKYNGEKPKRPTLNFLIAGDEFARNYEQAARSRDLRREVVVEASFIASLSEQPGFELAEVRVGHPLQFAEQDPSRYWRYDIGNRRYQALHDLRHVTVVRLATPDDEPRREIRVPCEYVVAWWDQSELPG